VACSRAKTPYRVKKRGVGFLHKNIVSTAGCNLSRLDAQWFSSDRVTVQGADMSIRIKARAGESAEQLVRRFKKMCEKEGLTKDIKRRAYYEKPSERKQRTMRKSVKRVDGAPVGRAKTTRRPSGPGAGTGRP
jgi:small subunit ribosomal protein S21